MKLNLKIYRQHYTINGYTPFRLFCTTTLTRKNRFAPWIVVDIDNCLFGYSVGDKFNRYPVKLGESYIIDKGECKVKIESEVIK